MFGTLHIGTSQVGTSLTSRGLAAWLISQINFNAQVIVSSGSQMDLCQLEMMGTVVGLGCSKEHSFNERVL